MDSQSVRSCLSDSEKGIDGNKRIKGIKRHLAVDSQGYPLAVHITTANVHDSRAAAPLIANTLCRYSDILLFKADQGYRGAIQSAVSMASEAKLECVKSNFGTADFIPLEGRWVVERTFSWMENYRRLTRNYERYLKTAQAMFITACVFFMIRYFR